MLVKVSDSGWSVWIEKFVGYVGRSDYWVRLVAEWKSGPSEKVGLSVKGGPSYKWARWKSRTEGKSISKWKSVPSFYSVLKCLLFCSAQFHSVAMLPPSSSFVVFVSFDYFAAAWAFDWEQKFCKHTQAEAAAGWKGRRGGEGWRRLRYKRDKDEIRRHCTGFLGSVLE